MDEYIERETIFRSYMDLCLAKSKLEKARKGGAFFRSDLLPETELSAKEWFRLIMAVPASDVAPVRHGWWIIKHKHRGGFHRYTGIDDMGEQHTITVDERVEYDDRYCSECGKQSADNFLTYCPNCGARMDGEADI